MRAAWGAGFVACLGAVWLVAAAPAAYPPTAAQAVVVSALPKAADANAVAQAVRALDNKQMDAALKQLKDLKSPAAALVRARALMQGEQYADAAENLRRAQQNAALAPLVALETGKLAWAQGQAAAAAAALAPLYAAGGAVATAATPTLVSALLVSDPNALLQMMPQLLAQPIGDDLNARSLLLDAKAAAQEKVGDASGALQTRLQRFLEEPVSTMTPVTPPVGTQPAPEQLLRRIEILLEANRNERAFPALEALPDEGLTPPQLCRKRMALGVAARKLHRYAVAEDHLGWVVQTCADEELVRRALYLQAKVISIRSGLRAIDAIEAFAKRFAGHSMVDDVLFWAGDLYQRRARDKEAQAYYERIEKLSERGDHCGEARWRIAWMAYQRREFPLAQAALERVLLPDGCATDRHDISRAHYWLGRIAEQKGDPAEALTHFRAIWTTQPLSFYAQQALPRLLAQLSKADRLTTLQGMMAPKASGSTGLCADWLAGLPGFGAGMMYLHAGLSSDAAAEFRLLAPPSQAVVGAAPAAALGVAPQPATMHALESLRSCGPAQATLLLVLLLDRAGAYHEAHWRLRTEFGDELTHFPAPEEMVVWRAAYPLAYRELIGPAEEESKLPTYFLQALAREESAFDAHVVSWAEAYGLTQLMYSSGQTAGRFLTPKVSLHAADELLDPALNARLGGALIGADLRRFANNPALALAAYNAGEDVAQAWWKKFSGQEFAVFAEEMTIQETRGYVQRVLRTYGIYRWLYADAMPSLPIDELVPKKS